MASTYSKYPIAKSPSVKNLNYSTKDLNDISKYLEIKTNFNDIPKGWYKTRDIAKKIKKSLSQTRELLIVAIRNKLIERKKFTIETIENYHITINYYHIKNKKYNDDWNLFFNSIDNIPSEWKSVKDLTKTIHKSLATIKRYVDIGIQNNLLKYKMFKRQNINGIHSTPYYYPFKHKTWDKFFNI